MKKFTLAFCLLVSMATVVSCSDVEPIDPDIILNPGPGPGPQPDPSCDEPTAFQASDFINGTNVNLSWVAGGDETAWEIQYGADGFEPGTGTSVASANTNYTIGGLNSANNYDFYIRSICSEESFSEWIGPVSLDGSTGPGPGPSPTFLYMNATVNGTQYTAMKPYFYPFGGFEPDIDNYDVNGDMVRVMHIQGNSNPLSNTLDNFVEINLHIKENHWAVGTYTLNGDNATWEESQAKVNLIIVQGTNTFTVYEDELPGTITITELNEATLRIKGTFNFTYNLDDNGTETGPFNVTGTFDYPVTEEVFN